jgi:hypothetical protein
MSDIFKLDKKAQRQIVDQAQQDLADNLAGALPLVTAGFDPNGSGDFVLVGAHALRIDKVAVRLTNIQAMAVVSQITQGLSLMMMQQAQAMAQLAAKTKS